MGRGLYVGLVVAVLASSVSVAAEYEGVKPGSDNPPPKVEEIPPGAQMLTWPGFVMRKDGTSCFFVQTSKPVDIATKEMPGEFDLVMRSTKVHLKNNYLPLETQFFATPVTRATVQRKGNAAVMVFEMRDDVTPTIRQEKGKDGFNYVFVEFAPTP